MTGNSRLLRFGDGKGWTFINGRWTDGPEEALMVTKELIREDGPGIQGHHYAICREKAYGDSRIQFQFRLTLHSDAGIILRAASPTDFYLLHFPNCGQASRAQHFWAALSRMDEQGFLRIRKLDLVRRVPSTNGLWLQADVRLTGKHLKVFIEPNGLFEAFEPDMPETGFIGIYLFGHAGIRNVSLEGDGTSPEAWEESVEPRRNWFHPCPDTEYGQWQQPGQLVRSRGGDLLLNYNVQEKPYQGAITSLVVHSGDNGRTWSKPEAVTGMKTGEWDGWGVLHAFPDEKVRLSVFKEDWLGMGETLDDGGRWTKPCPVTVSPKPKGIRQLHFGPQVFLNLSDGSMLMFAYGSHDSTVPDSSIYRWGSCHCQAFAARSRDSGRTWSNWVNLDGTKDPQEKSVDGNLDLTEVCAAQTMDGRVLALVRPIYSPWMWETWSGDGGATWTPCMRGPFPGYATSNMLRTSSGAILVAHRLPGCTLHASWDGGRTWDGGTLIDSAIWVMGSMMEVEPDVVLYIYWDSFESLMRAQFLRVTPGGLFPAG